MPVDSNVLGLPQRLGSGLVLRAVASEADVVRVVRLNGQVHGDEGEEWSRWYLSPPLGLSPRRDCLLVEDEATGEVVSTLVLLPRTWSLEGTPLRVGQVELVSTHPAYRKQGLVRAQMRAVVCLERLQEHDLSCIAGIPYFYRQFGYEFSLPLGGGWLLSLEQVLPLASGQVEPVTIRPFVLESDLAVVAGLYAEQGRGLGLHSLRDEASWRHQSVASARLFSTFTVLDRGGAVVGYLRLEPMRDSQELLLSEAALRPEHACRATLLALLRFAARATQTLGFGKLRVTLWDEHPLAVVARGLGAESVPRYAWQVRLPDESAFLRRIRQVLERRLADSVLAGYSGVLDLNLYRRLLRLRFVHGELASVDDEGQQQEAWTARFSPEVASMLLLGYRSREELCAWYPDVTVRPEARLLIDTLFPKRVSHVYAL